MRRVSKKVPGSIVAVVLGLIAAYFLNGYMHIKTVGDVGIIPSTIPMPHIPSVTWELVTFVLPAALTIAALAAIESLLSAVVADGMTGKKHDSNKELRGQGLANIASALFGGLNRSDSKDSDKHKKWRKDKIGRNNTCIDTTGDTPTARRDILAHTACCDCGHTDVCSVQYGRMESRI